MNSDKTDLAPNTLSHTYELDLSVYRPYFESADISEEDKRRLIEAMWSIMSTFVHLGYGLTPAQQVLDNRPKTTCGQLPRNRDHGPIPASDWVEYSPSIIENFVNSAHADDEEGVSV